MKYKYIVAGISIINDIYYVDGSVKKNRLGGCAIYAYGGISLFSDSVLFLSTGGKDFFDYYGDYFERNNISKEGIYLDLPFTHHTELIYEKDSTWHEKSIYGDDYFSLQSENNRTSLEKLKPFLSKDTKGLYLDSAAHEKIFEEIDEIRKLSPNIKIMWEPPSFSSKDSSMHNRILENLNKVDYYSMNIDEASSFFMVDENQIIEKIIELNIPCFLRKGEKGSSWIEETIVTSCDAIEVGKAVDVTGCGNTSAAAALYWKIEGKSYEDIVYNANKAASISSKYEGPIYLIEKHHEFNS